MAETIHIISFDVPLPANYGGVIDVYYKIKALKKIGVNVILHAYQYGRKADPKLNELCHKVFYYHRRTYINPFTGAMPYIVKTRNTKELLQNLLLDDYPILFEGLHTTYYLSHQALKNRFKMVRMHNIEHHYYKHLERAEPNFFKKYFFRNEADKLRKYQNILKHANTIFAISNNDEIYLKRRFNNVLYLPAFHSNNEIIACGKTKPFVLYHGNLSVSENYTAAMTLINNVFSKLKIKCIVAGNNPPKELTELTKRYSHIDLLSDVSTAELHQLISKAHVNVLYTHQNTGIKLKLLNVLYRGHFVLVNDLMVKGTGLEDICNISYSFDEMVKNISKHLQSNFNQYELEARKAILYTEFNNEKSAQIIKNQMHLQTVVA